MDSKQKDRFQKIKTENPGPGSYEDHRSLGGGPKTIMTGRHNKAKADYVPGPGQYNTDIPARSFSTSHKYSMGNRLKYHNSSAAPGPGSYNTETPRPKTGAKFGTSTRKGLPSSSVTQFPGPGSYIMQSSGFRSTKSPNYG